MKNKIKLFLTFSSISLLPLLAFSCQSSFYDLTRVLEANYSNEIHKLFSQYKVNYEKFSDFFALSDNSKENAFSYFYNRWFKANKISSYFAANVLNNSKVNTILMLSDENKDIGYFENNTFISLKNTFNAFLTDFSMNEIDYTNNFMSKMNRFWMLNNEMKDIINDDARAYSNWSFSEFYNQFFNSDLGNDYPLFKNTDNPSENREIFNDRLNDIFNRFNNEYKAKIFNEDIKNIDYSKLGFSLQADGTYGHSHALINLWNEWNSMTLVYYKDKEIVTDKNNRLKIIKDLFSDFKSLNKDNKTIYIIDKNDDKKNFNLSNFLISWEDLVKNNNIEIEKNNNSFNNFKKHLLDSSNNMISIAKRIINTIKNYNN
ncbi:hypothetical protein MM26B8_02320 [Mycoplasmopsis meleagridis]|uniref:Lipoprotein n=1 Tax=Mycoplasmopsis meleagridis ATCC 25294 TaxID=1264554 RepID=A0A0F5H0L8_9BACT|nr:hypothetical protein [Mycoplasmopsis meleagridis]KKB26824.1 hypothetical protein MMELEA_05060 [Mycoplasmopsis meleagridis ATCC 25294]KUH47373.1 hypothetical protein ASB56_01520 [Mycoplasmopsis meleagridis]OAD18395.1 hypothetical protein MM26B8_02320 [Mycoplasmopsis meleagridis]VEU77437.1 Uncharacterised protein [Mycoplasmopsis meleagridis]